MSGSDNAKAKEGLFVNAKSHGLRVEAICPAGESKVGAPNLAGCGTARDRESDPASKRLSHCVRVPTTGRGGFYIFIIIMNCTHQIITITMLPISIP